MINKAFISLVIFYFASFIGGFTPAIYENDYNSFAANQTYWVLIMIVLRIAIVDKYQQIIIETLIFFTSFELLDEILRLNYYLPNDIPANYKKLLLDLIIIVAGTIFTTKRLYKQWMKEHG